jgi:hypothetical protein
MTTDRAKRYAANRHVTDDPKGGCLFCGSKRNLGVDHISGDESDGHPSNLAYLCKSCNTRKGAAFKKAGIGRLTHQYNPYLGLDPQERKNFSQLGFDFPPRPEYDQARASDRKRRQQAHTAELKRRREEKQAETRRAKAERAEEQKRIKAQISALGASLQKARRDGDKAAVRELVGEINDLNSEVRRNPAASITTPRQWSEAVTAVLGGKSYMTTRSAASRIRATSPGQRRKLASKVRENPAKYPSFQQYVWGVTHHSRGAVDEGGAIIHATPESKRAEYARYIAGIKAERGTDRRDKVPF